MTPQREQYDSCCAPGLNKVSVSVTGEQLKHITAARNRDQCQSPCRRIPPQSAGVLVARRSSKFHEIKESWRKLAAQWERLAPAIDSTTQQAQHQRAALRSALSVPSRTSTASSRRSHGYRRNSGDARQRERPRLVSRDTAVLRAGTLKLVPVSNLCYRMNVSSASFSGGRWLESDVCSPPQAGSAITCRIRP
jgi:hypothetical protein